MAQARNLCFTLNNPREDDAEAILAWESKYVVVGQEVGDEKGTPHLQCYIEWASPKRFETLKKLDPRIHWEARKGTAAQAADYCKKDGSFKERGVLSAPGKRTDLDTVGAMVVAGAPIAAVAAAHPGTFIRYGKGIVGLKAALMVHRTVRPSVRWRYGPTGVGKTHQAASLHGDYYLKDSTQWWDGYEQQAAIVVDDFDGKWPYRDLLRLFDCYKYQGQYKGGYVPINSPFIYITAEHPPSHFWQGTELAQVMRRLESVTHVVAIGNETVTHTSSTVAQPYPQSFAPGLDTHAAVGVDGPVICTLVSATEVRWPTASAAGLQTL